MLNLSNLINLVANRGSDNFLCVTLCLLGGSL